jgi:4'-phosphopantetheinyl transferase EntD
MEELRSLAMADVLTSLAPPGILIDHRLIATGDETALLPAEEVSFAHSVIKVRRQSGAARIVARSLLRRLGVPDFTLIRAPAGGLIWPPGLLGSVSHDDRVALAAVAAARDYASIGVDLEPADPLPRDLVPMVATPSECRRYSNDVLSTRLLFVIKEAVFKAVHPTDGVFLDFHDVEVDLETHSARLGSGRTIQITAASAVRTIAIAYEPPK